MKGTTIFVTKITNLKGKYICAKKLVELRLIKMYHTQDLKQYSLSSSETHQHLTRDQLTSVQKKRKKKKKWTKKHTCKEKLY